uniref:Uncharacterized protein n=1 Tax=Clastoptera arizonana TaxID=38151 RepID=A0A1B6DYT8_9HEMI
MAQSESTNVDKQKLGSQHSNGMYKNKPLLFTAVVTVGVLNKIVFPYKCREEAIIDSKGKAGSDDKIKKGSDKITKPQNLSPYSKQQLKKKCQPKESTNDSVILPFVRQIQKKLLTVINEAKKFCKSD